MKDLLENKLFKICLISVIVIIMLIIIIAMLVGGGSKTISESALLNAAKKYYSVNPSQLPTENYDTRRVALATLVANGYISDKLDGTNCPSYVTVTNMNGNYEYNATMLCDTKNAYNTPLINKLTSSIVTSGSGLYSYNGAYIFRGENPNNHIKIGELKWRIIGIEPNNTIKVIYNDIYNEYIPWDDRYNKEVDQLRGINDYIGNEKSRIKEYLDNYFKNEINGDKYTSSVIALTVPHSVCVGKLDIKTNSNICSNTLENQRISTITINDYVNASLDPACSVTNSINCQNYNFLNKQGWTINANAENSYTAYYIDADEGLKSNYTSLANAVRPVLTLRNSVVYISGTGTETDPYIVK